MTPVIHTPVAGFTGTVAGVNFADGVGETDDTAALLYFSGAGYDVHDEEPPADIPVTPEGPDPVTPSELQGEPDEDASSGTPDQDASDRPHPVQGSKAAWFEYLTRIKPDHGFDLETSKRDELRAAVEEFESAK
ncbi:hypothetical protein J2Y69_003072 [Microbacterium resistens]|uniref:Uncharacterized protein n=1 Tax=Microbacterium resistens TaxID=156977 RepID=A0ABU1SFT9_9MICO|nr:hypothetical protein [Microbacterium resistens]MDR6868456.1 hypothetical protein [Microbacterium resistens]